MQKYQIPLSTKCQISRSTKYKEVRDTMKYEIPGRAKYTGMDNIPGSHRKDYTKVITVGVLRYSNLKTEPNNDM